MSEVAGDAGGEGTCPCLHGRDVAPPPIDGTGTDAELVGRGEGDPERLPDAVARHTDVTIALPLLEHYVCARHDRRPLRRLYGRREELVEKLGEACRRASGPPGEPGGDGGVLARLR